MGPGPLSLALPQFLPLYSEGVDRVVSKVSRALGCSLKKKSFYMRQQGIVCLSTPSPVRGPGIGASQPREASGPAWLPCLTAPCSRTFPGLQGEEAGSRGQGWNAEAEGLREGFNPGSGKGAARSRFQSGVHGAPPTQAPVLTVPEPRPTGVCSSQPRPTRGAGKGPPPLGAPDTNPAALTCGSSNHRSPAALPGTSCLATNACFPRGDSAFGHSF